MSVGRDGYVGMVRVPDGTDQPGRRGRSAGAARKGTGRRRSRRFSAGPELRLPADSTGPNGAEPDFSRGKVPAWRRNGCCLLGDAAGYVEPFTGEGMTWAMLAAVSVAPLAQEWLRPRADGNFPFRVFSRCVVAGASVARRPSATGLPGFGLLVTTSRGGAERPGSDFTGSGNRETVDSLFLESEGSVMSLCIKGIGTAVPRHCIAQEDLAEVAGRFCGLNDKQRRMLPTLYRHAGVKKRHSVVLAGPSNRDAAGQSFYQSVEIGGPNGPSTADRMRVYAECATPLAADACRRALAAAQMEPEEITHLVTVSCSGFCSGRRRAALPRVGAFVRVSRGRTSVSWGVTGHSTVSAWPVLLSRPIRTAAGAPVRDRTLHPAPSVRVESRSDRGQCALCRRIGGRRLRPRDGGERDRRIALGPFVGLDDRAGDGRPHELADRRSRFSNGSVGPSSRGDSHDVAVLVARLAGGGRSEPGASRPMGNSPRRPAAFCRPASRRSSWSPRPSPPREACWPSSETCLRRRFCLSSIGSAGSRRRVPGSCWPSGRD